MRCRAPLQRQARRDDAGRGRVTGAGGRGGAAGGSGPAAAFGAAGIRRRRGATGVQRAHRATGGASDGEGMSEVFDNTIEADRGTTEPAMIVDVEGFEGPLDLLLMLARQQKVDLAKISILALADQYLGFIEEARKLRLELAADYLVMAAWLAYLKSRLLLPEAAPAEGPSAEDMALALANRLRRLEAIREAAGKLMDRPQFGRDVFGRGDPEPIAEIKRPEWTATLYDLLTAYAQQRQRTA